jgi:hypothetical protein
MQSIQPRPTSRQKYFDRLQVWLRHPLDQTSIDWLRSECGGRLPEPDNRPAGFDPKYRQRLQPCQPSSLALEWFADLNDDSLRYGRDQPDVYINQVELALDLTFSSSRELHAAFRFEYANLIRRWHSPKQEVRLYRKGKDGKCRALASTGQPI